MSKESIFYTAVREKRERSQVRSLIDSIRTFGGDMKGCPIWVFEAAPEKVPCESLNGDGIKIIPMIMPDRIKDYALAAKVRASARAEALLGSEVRTMIWIDPVCLVIQPPLLFELGERYDAAVRPVHIQNVGLFPDQDLNAFWEKIYETTGVDDIKSTVETFVGGETIRAYYNSHAFSIRPSKGLMQKWYDLFEALVYDASFQNAACSDVQHKIFLHQGILSALLVTDIPPDRIRILPPDYNYPYNLHESVPSDRKVSVLNDVVCFAYEDRSLNPENMGDIEVQEPLKSWLMSIPE